MHILRTETRTLDDIVEAVDLAQSPADLVFLSFSDSDLAVMAEAWDRAGPEKPGLRIASLAQLRHPYSVDLHVEKVCTGARFVLVRLLGGLDYWRYGVEQLSSAAARHGFELAVVPGDHMEDPRLDAASTLPEADLRLLWRFFQAGGTANASSCLGFVASRVGVPMPWREPEPLPPAGRFEAACRTTGCASGRALLVLYRSHVASADTAPVEALADALAARALSVDALHVTSLKDPAAACVLADQVALWKPDIILNATAFSGRTDEGGSVLDAADCPVLQVILAGSGAEAWRDGTRGLAPADLAMNVVLPEADGRIVTRAISFKEAASRSEALQATRLMHRPDPSRVAAVADLAASWVRLARTPRGRRRVALVLSDYPGKGGREGYAVGLDTPASVGSIAGSLRRAGYAVANLPEGDALMRALAGGSRVEWPVASYREALGRLPEAFRASLEAAWGDPAEDPAVRGGAFAFRAVEAGSLLVALQPDRGAAADRRADHHDVSRPPRHAYVAFYLWLRHERDIHAMVHAGTHGTLEWLPGKAVALSASCAPEAVLGPVPVVYPFIVNNPGEAAQARRRIAAVTVGHLTPPLVAAGVHGAAGEIEGLLDEYSEAQGLDARRSRRLADLILERARETGLADEAGLGTGADPDEALQRLDAWICDLKDMRIGDGLHVFGREPSGATVAALAASFPGVPDAEGRVRACGMAEAAALLAALDGRFVQPGPAGAPQRGRLDVLPTGRNLVAADPRSIPTRTAWEIGRRIAEEVVLRYGQDHGEWPRAIVLDLWGSATTRTGGDDLAQAFALIGVRPTWDHSSSRVSGFEILPPAALGRPRVDVTLRISGLFRDMFPAQIALFDEAARAVAVLDEDEADNPLAAAARAGQGGSRIFGAAPGTYGAGVAERVQADRFEDRAELGEAYLAATSHAYGKAGETPDAGFRERVAGADAFVHVQDLPGQDILDSDAFAEHEGGFAAATAALGTRASLYHVDATDPGRGRVRTLAETVALVVRGRVANPRWIAGQRRHGHRGAAEIAESLDNLYAFAATTEAVASRHFDLVWDATLGDEDVRAFLLAANPEAARAMAERFAAARDRGYWHARRNSSAAVLRETLEAAE